VERKGPRKWSSVELENHERETWGHVERKSTQAFGLPWLTESLQP